MRNLLSCFLLLFLISSWNAVAATEEATLDTGTGKLFGSLLIPAGDGPFPVVLIISGSGPTDRNGNSALIPGQNNSLRQLAEGLAVAGVASLRFDKRGIAASRPAGLSEKDLRFEHMIDDARLWCRWLLDDPRFSSLTVAGHSEGSQVGANAAWLAGADGFVSIAGPGRPILDVLREQLAQLLSVRNRVKAEAVMQSLAKGVLVEEPPPELTILFRTSVQPYLISWSKYDPQVDVARFDGPVTIIQGTTDIQVSVHDAELLAAAQPRARLVVLEGVNHILKPVAESNPIAQQMSYGDSTLVVSPEAVAAVVELTGKAEEYRREKQEALARVSSFNGFEIQGKSYGAEDFPQNSSYPTAAQRVGFWVRRFLKENSAQYRFGLAEGGDVEQGRLVMDDRLDCVSFMYRCTELARAADPRDALDWALRTRFAGASPLAVVDSDGAVDYDCLEHLDFSLDMIRTGIWGRDITSRLTGAAVDTVGSLRYPAGAFQFVPGEDLDTGELNDGDIVWLVLDEANKKGARLRGEYGLVIGHIGIVMKQDGQTLLVHAAGSGLPGYYDEGGLVSVPLKVYLDRVEKFSGVVVTRL